MTIETYIWEYYPVIHETNLWFVKIHFIYNDNEHWTATDKAFEDKREAELRAIQLAIWLEGKFVADKAYATDI